MINRKVTEFEVQAEAYHRLKEHFSKLGISVRGEFILKIPGKRGARFDIALLKDGKIIFVVEVKRFARENRSQKKLGYYSALTGVPCIHISGMGEAFDVVKIVTDRLYNPGETNGTRQFYNDEADDI